MRVLPPGPYVVRARVRSGGDPIGELRRRFEVVGAERAADDAGSRLPAVNRSGVRSLPAARLPLVASPPFALDQVLSPPVLNVFSTAWPHGPMRLPRRSGTGRTRPLRRPSRVRRLRVPGGRGSGGRVPQGLTLLSRRNSIRRPRLPRGDARFGRLLPAMVYLGACYAAGGNDRRRPRYGEPRSFAKAMPSRFMPCSPMPCCARAGGSRRRRSRRGARPLA